MRKKGEANHPLFNLPQFLGFKASYPATVRLPLGFHNFGTFFTIIRLTNQLTIFY